MSDNGKAEVEVEEVRLYQALGQAIRKRRKGIGLTQEDLAAAMGMSRTSVVNLEAGRQRPPLTTVYKVAAMLEAELDELLPPVGVMTNRHRPEIETQHGLLPPKTAAVLQEVEEEEDDGRPDQPSK